MDHLPNPAGRGAVIARYPFAISDQVFALLAMSADIITILAMSLLSSAVYHQAVYGGFGLLKNYLASSLLVIIIYIPLRLARGKYLVKTLLNEGRNVESMFLSWNYAFLALLIIGFVTKETEIYSRAAIVLFYLSGFAALMAVREAVFRLAESGFRKGLLLGKPVMLLGTEKALKTFHRRYNPHLFGLRVVDEIVLKRSAADDAETFRKRLNNIAARARALRVEDIFILQPLPRKSLIGETLNVFLDMPVSVHLGPDSILDTFRDARVEHFGAMTSLELVRPPLSEWAHWLKRGLDITGALTGLVVLSPVLILAAIAIKLDSSGPVFFMQTRQGFNHKPFRIFKFRTMRVMEDSGDIRQATRDDPRVTRVGRFLRRWSIDELPQLINVLKGDMSLVGPRPHAMNHDNIFERKVRLYARRHKVLPGITGWAQVNGYRGETDTGEKIMKRVEYDLEYIDRWSIWFDLYIIALTIFSPRTWRNAY